MTKELTDLRNKELRKIYSDIISSGVNRLYMDKKSIVNFIYDSPAPRFYISPKMAEQYVLRYKEGKFATSGLLKREMIKDLADNFDRLVSECGNTMMRIDMWEKLTTLPAKSFYIKKSTIKGVIYGYIR